MEVDTYFLRPTAAELAAAPAARAEPEGRREAAMPSSARPRRESPPPEAERRNMPESRQPAPAESEAPLSSPEPASAHAPEPVLEPVEPFTLHCVRAAEALLFCLPQQSQSLRRLANDVAASVRIALDVPPAELKLLEFRYPHLARASADWRPALRAFTSKQVDVVRPRLVLVTADAAERFDWLEADAQVLGDRARLLMIDELSALHADAERKRALWQQIRNHLA